MTIKLITPPAEEPVSLDDFKSHLHGVAESDDDADLSLKLLAARQYIEGTECGGRALITSTWEVRLGGWPCKHDYIELPLGNLQSVAWIKYTDTADVEHVWNPACYRVARTYTPADPNADPPVLGDGPNDAYMGRVYLAYGQWWPATVLQAGEPIAIRFTCGWDGAASVPADLKAAIELYAAHLYENRSAVTDGARAVSVPTALAIESLCSRYVDRRY